MILPITKELLAAAYDYLCCAPPFRKWSLPPSDEIAFRVTTKRLFAEYQRIGRQHYIRVSRRLVGSHTILLSTLAHEMIHLHLEEVGACDDHGPNFQLLADEVCKCNGFDRLTF
jgi:hypothetical protein